MKQSPQKPNYKEWKRQKVKVADLFLDSKNIRLDSKEVELSQDALINDLFLNEDALQVLKSIAINGFFPDETPVAVKENGKFIVLEGNRRLAAIKALLRPEITPSKEAIIKSLLKNAVPVSNEQEIVLAPDRNSAMVFLANKHTLNTKKNWRPLRQAYFYKAELDRGKTIQNLRDEYPTVDVNKFLRLLNIHKIAKSIKYDSPSTEKKVHNEKTFPATTAERLYEDKNVRNFLGFDFDGNGDVKINIKKEEFEKGFKRIIEDVVEKNVDSRALNKESDRKSYLSNFPKDSVPQKTKSGKTITSKDFKEIKIASIKKRKKLAPNDIVFKLKCKGVQRVLKELQAIDYNKFPNATHDLLRSFLECGLKAYFEDCSKKISPKKTGGYVYLDTVLEVFINEMNQDKNTKLSQVASRIRSNSKMTAYSATFLNATNHNPDIFVTPQEVEDAWDTMEPLFRYILSPKQKTNGQNKP